MKTIGLEQTRGKCGKLEMHISRFDFFFFLRNKRQANLAQVSLCKSKYVADSLLTAHTAPAFGHEVL